MPGFGTPLACFGPCSFKKEHGPNLLECRGVQGAEANNLKYRQESAGEFLVRYYDLFYNGKIDKKHR